MADEVGDEDIQDAFIELEADPPVHQPRNCIRGGSQSESARCRSSTGQDPVLNQPFRSGGTENGTRHFEFTGGNSNKFWEITLAGTQHTVRFGRIGTKGQIVTKTFEDVAVARRDCERLIRSKQAKGYREE